MVGLPILPTNSCLQIAQASKSLTIINKYSYFTILELLKYFLRRLSINRQRLIKFSQNQKGDTRAIGLAPSILCGLPLLAPLLHLALHPGRQNRQAFKNTFRQFLESTTYNPYTSPYGLKLRAAFVGARNAPTSSMVLIFRSEKILLFQILGRLLLYIFGGRHKPRSPINIEIYARMFLAQELMDTFLGGNDLALVQ